MRLRVGLMACALVAACGGEQATAPSGAGGAGGDHPGAGGSGGSAPVIFPDPLPPLPGPGFVSTERFVDGGQCGQCHLGQEGDDAMRDAAGRDVSPVKLWRSSMMALAARDPYYLAVFSDELRTSPSAKTTIERTCTRCHSPAAHLELGERGTHLSFDALVGDDTEEARLARDGITCTLCHQIADQALGTASSYSGGFEVGFNRELFGPHDSPVTQPMEMFIDYTPVAASHISSSAVCATCHTVIVTPLEGGSPVVEQAPYLEWRASDYSTESGGSKAADCVDCHVPKTDRDGQPISTKIARFNTPLSERQPYGRHLMVGGNAGMLEVFAEHGDWSGSTVPPTEFLEAAERSREHLREAAGLQVLDASVSGSALSFSVRVSNFTGHKLPTGYPTRRMWLHTRVLDGDGAVLFESGRHDARGALLGGDGTRLDPAGVILPHVTDVTSPDDVPVFEAILVDAEGHPTHRALGADHYGKDNRLLPSGWTGSGALAPVGVAGDASFTAARDDVRFDVTAAGATRIEVTLLYQSIPPAVVDTLGQVPTAAAVLFHQLLSATPSVPVAMATTTHDLP